MNTAPRHEIRIPITNPLAGSDDEPVDLAIQPWLKRGFRVVCTDVARGLYEARKPQFTPPLNLLS